MGVLCLCFLVCAATPVWANEVTGELKKWHRVAVTFDGPATSETDALNPFLDYRMQVTFTHSATGTTYNVPGFYAADGDAANTGAESGNKWRVYFTPDQTGTWTYTAEFITGTEVAISLDAVPAGSSSAGFFDGESGSFFIEGTDKTGDDFRARGRLDYVGEHYLKFAETGEYYLKNGLDSPENFLAYDEFDGTYDAGDKNCTTGELFLHSYTPHAGDWNAGDPTWGPTQKGKNIIGAVNYMAQTHGNSMYMITFNTDGGDGCDVWPWTTYEERYRFDVSKMDQWEIVFRHLQHKGLQLHIVLAERENRTALENSLGIQRKLYYRELVARYAHHPVLQWNIGEEHNISNARRRDYAQYIHDQDPYDHSVAIHSTATDPMDFYITGSGGGDPIVGAPMYEVSSIQGAISEYNEYPIILREATANAGRPWAIYADEQTIDAPPGIDKEIYRHTHGTWGHFLGGGAGVEWFLSADLTLEDFSADEGDRLITQHAVDFFEAYLPFWEMEPDNSLTTAPESFAFHKPGEIYAVSLSEGGTTDLDLTGYPGTYTVQWYDPWNGGALQDGTLTTIDGDGLVNIGMPPHTTNEQWVALITFFQANESPVAAFSTSQTYLTVDLDASASSDDGTIVSWDWDLGDSSTGSGEITSHTYAAAGTYTIQLTVTDDQGAVDTESMVVSVIENPDPVASFTHATTDLTANFTDTSTDDGAISSWSWDFGDGNTSTAQNPAHTYADGGTFTVSLTVTDDFGATGTTNQDVTVTAPNVDPVASYTFTTTDLTADFTDTSTDEGTITAWSWDFGDTNTSTAQNPSHTYGSAGTYTVQLIVTDDLGAMDTTSQDVTVTAPNGDPVAGYTFVVTDLTADFTDTSTDDGTITAWAWDFGDTNTSTAQNPSHTYGSAGTYTVQLIVTDDIGAMDTTSQDVTVTAPNGDPVAGFTFAVTDLTTDFTDTSTDDGTITAWNWNFGDTNTSTTQNPTHTYAAAGTYSVQLIVTDDLGAVDTTSQDVTVSDPSPGTGSFLESGGLLVVEAEHFTSQVDRSGHTWLPSTAFAGFTGESAMLADPNTGADIRKNDAFTLSPEMIFNAEFATLGSYYVWIRVFAPSDTDNTIHLGLNGAISASKMETLVEGDWSWTNLDTKDKRMTVGVTEAGLSTLHVWMREDGILIDKIVLSTDVNFVPTGDGPPESPRDGIDTPPSASYTYTTTDLTANFTDTSTDNGTISSWSWNFGDTNTSTAQNPTHTYAAAGTYSVQLIVTDDLGAMDTTSQDVTVTAPNVEPVASYTFTTTDLTADFTDTSTDEGAITAWNWDFGDTNTSTAQNPTHTYAAAGTYSVQLIVTDDVGAMDTTSQDVTVTVPNGDPVASYTFTTTDLTANFTDTSTDDGTISSWNWDFGDSNTSTDQNPSHTYTFAGTYSVQLIVTDDLGAVDTTSQDVTVSESSPSTGSFLESGGLLVVEAEHFTSQVDRSGHTWMPSTAFAGFTGESAMLADPNTGADIRKNDAFTLSPEMIFNAEFETLGSYYVWIRVFAPSDTDNTIHLGLNGAISASKMETLVEGDWSWTNMDTKDKRMTVGVTEVGLSTLHVWMREDGILIDKIVLSTDVNFVPTADGPPESPRDGVDAPPTASFTYTTTDLTANFTDTSTDNGTITSRSWDFGDTNTSTAQNPTHTYAAAGTYSVQLIVTDDLGAMDTTSQDVTVSAANVDPVASYTFTTTDLTANFTDTSTDEGTITAWSWDFGDTNTSTAQNPTHVYGAAGTYAVQLIVTDDLGAMDTTSQDVTVTAPNGDPVAGFTVVTNELVATFTDTSTDDGTVSSWSWDFGDTNTSTDQNPEHTYAAPGTYSVQLIVTDDLGAADTTSQDVTVEQAPVAGFTFVATDLTVDFTDASTDDSLIVAWAWEFGDGATDTLQHPQHIYAAAGTYSVVLTVTDNVSLTASDTVDVTVTEPGIGPFLESAGMVVMEAENYFTKIDRGVHAWVDTTSQSGFSGSGAMLADPNTGELVRKNKATTDSPEMQYEIEFTETGSYYVWARVYGEADGDLTVHGGVDGVVSASKLEGNVEAQWTWTNLDTKDKRVTVGILTPGPYTFNVWMRDDGLYIDKIVLTTDPDFTPTGLGPTESSRASSAPESMSTMQDAGALRLTKEQEEIPVEFVLDGNYPNPFNPMTTIRFGLPEASSVALTIYDLQGKEVTRLLDQQLDAGYHHISWNAGHLPSGVYFYRLDAGTFSDTGKMLLVK